MSALPGDSTTRIPGLHFFKDKLYAVVDLVAMEVATINTVTDCLRGAELSKTSGGASSGRLELSGHRLLPAMSLSRLSISSQERRSVPGRIFTSGPLRSPIGTPRRRLKGRAYCADWDGAGGWTRVDLGRRVEYDEGAGTTDATAFFLPYVRRDS